MDNIYSKCIHTIHLCPLTNGQSGALVVGDENHVGFLCIFIRVYFQSWTSGVAAGIWLQRRVTVGPKQPSSNCD